MVRTAMQVWRPAYQQAGKLALPGGAFSYRCCFDSTLYALFVRAFGKTVVSKNPVVGVIGRRGLDTGDGYHADLSLMCSDGQTIIRWVPGKCGDCFTQTMLAKCFGGFPRVPEQHSSVLSTTG